MMDGSWEGDEGWKMYTKGEREMETQKQRIDRIELELGDLRGALEDIRYFIDESLVPLLGVMPDLERVVWHYRSEIISGRFEDWHDWAVRKLKQPLSIGEISALRRDLIAIFSLMPGRERDGASD